MTVKAKRKICSTLGWLFLLGVYIIFNNLDSGVLPIWPGALYASLSGIIGTFLLYKAGWIKI